MTNNLPAQVDDEALVAYLDGELSLDERSQIDHSLANDATLRERLSKLSIAWDLLGELPDVQPGRDLTQSTIAMVALTIKKDKSNELMGWLANRWLWLAAGVAVLFSAGLWTGNQRSTSELKQTLRDLPILDRYAQLAHIESVAWLRKLATVENLVEAGNGVAEYEELLPIPEDPAQRLEWIDRIDSSRRQRLATNQRSFALDAPERQAELRQIGKLLSDSTSEENLNSDFPAVINAYANIFDRVGTTERTHLLAIDDLDKRAAQVAILVRRELAMAYAKKLSERDKAALRNWNYMIQADLDFFSRLPDSNSHIVSELYKEPDQSFIRSEDLTALKAQLSEKAQSLLEGLEEQQQRDVIGLWLLYNVVTQQASSPADLRKRFAGLSLERQAEIEFLSEREAREAVAATNSVDR